MSETKDTLGWIEYGEHRAGKTGDNWTDRELDRTDWSRTELNESWEMSWLNKGIEHLSRPDIHVHG